MRFREINSDGETCSGECEACVNKDSCEDYDGCCKIRCEECFYWSGGCEAGLPTVAGFGNAE